MFSLALIQALFDTLYSVTMVCMRDFSVDTHLECEYNERFHDYFTLRSLDRRYWNADCGVCKCGLMMYEYSEWGLINASCYQTPGLSNQKDECFRLKQQEKVFDIFL